MRSFLSVILSAVFIGKVLSLPAEYKCGYIGIVEFDQSKMDQCNRRDVDTLLRVTSSQVGHEVNALHKIDVRHWRERTHKSSDAPGHPGIVDSLCPQTCENLDGVSDCTIECIYWLPRGQDSSCELEGEEGRMLRGRELGEIKALEVLADVDFEEVITGIAGYSRHGAANGCAFEKEDVYVSAYFYKVVGN
jgi:hypothetical protein